MSDCIERQLWDDVLKVATTAHCTAVRIYNTIREVGYKKLSADNALHQMVEDYKNLQDLGAKAMQIADTLNTLATKVEAEAQLKTDNTCKRKEMKR